MRVRYLPLLLLCCCQVSHPAIEAADWTPPVWLDESVDPADHAAAREKAASAELTAISRIGYPNPATVVLDGLRTQRQARQRFEAMRRGIAERQYRRPAGGAGRATLPELGTLGWKQAFPDPRKPRLDFEAVERDQAAGDWFEFQRSYYTKKGLARQVTGKRWITGVAGDLVASISVVRSDQGVEVEDGCERKMGSLEDELVLDLSKIGPVVAKSYREEAATFELKGRHLACRRAVLEAVISIDGKNVPTVVRYTYVPDLLHSFEALSCVVEWPKLLIAYELRDFGRSRR